MIAPPDKIRGVSVRYYAVIDERCRCTGKCKHWMAGKLQGPAAALAICQYEGEHGYYLFYLDRFWEAVTDTWHETPDSAMNQAEFEYEGVSKNWLEM